VLDMRVPGNTTETTLEPADGVSFNRMKPRIQRASMPLLFPPTVDEAIEAPLKKTEKMA